MPKIRTISPLPSFQAIAVLSQAAPVQNTYYTVLDTVNNARIYDIVFTVADTGETIEGRITIDGVTLSFTQAANAGTQYFVTLYSFGSTFGVSTSNASAAYILEGRSIKIEIRKTTAAGAGTLTARCVYGKW